MAKYNLHLVSKCDNCGHVSVKSSANTMLVIALYVAVVFLVMSGIVAIAFVWYTGFSLDGALGYIVNAKYDRINANDKDFLRSYALNVTSECNTDKVECFASSIFSDLARKIKYVHSSQYDDGVYPSRSILESGRSDCKNDAATYCALMKSVGFNCWVSVSVEKSHAVSVFESNNNSECVRYVVDLTVPGAYVIRCNDDPFSIYDNDPTRNIVSDDAIDAGW